MASKSGQNTPRTPSSVSQGDESKNVEPRQDSVRSSRLGSFIEDEPTFESQGSSDTDSEVLPVGPAKLPVSVVWQNLVVETSEGFLRRNGRRVLNSVSGYAEPRTVLAVVGPAKSGKSALVDVIGNRSGGYSSVSGSLVVNGRSLRDSGVVPTYFCASDEPLANVTVEQALIYTALLQMPDTGSGELEAEVRHICERLGLLNELSLSTDSLAPGTKRRLTVACQMISSTSLLVMHDTLLGIQEGDALAIMRAVYTLTKEGCTAVVVCQQPTTDICSFFTNAYILVNGEAVYFGDAANQAVNLLMSAGMPCPPLYSPVEQYMRLVDPSFEVYLQTHLAGQHVADDFNARFSSMMFKVLQGTYQASPLATEAERRALILASATYDPINDRKGHISAPRQWFVLCRRLVTQGLQGLPLYLGRIIFTVIISLVYGGSYWKLNTSFLGAAERTTILFIAAAVIPALAIGTLPFYTNGSKVFLREHRRCRLGWLTHFAALFTLTLPHLAAAAVLSAVAFLLMVDLNSSGAGWGYFIAIGTVTQMCADSMILFLATIIPNFHQIPVALGLFLIQALASGFFPGANRGFNLPVSVVSFTSWSYKGLLQNEFLYRTETWGCPGYGRAAPLSQGACSLDSRGAYQVLSNSQTLLPDSRWISVYILIGIYVFWSLAYLAALLIKSRPAKYRLSSELAVGGTEPLPVVINPLHSIREQNGQPVNGSGPQVNREPPV